jgi:hypothetical protein
MIGLLLLAISKGIKLAVRLQPATQKLSNVKNICIAEP